MVRMFFSLRSSVIIPAGFLAVLANAKLRIDTAHKINELIKQMTLEEKSKLIMLCFFYFRRPYHRLGISLMSIIMMAHHGVRPEHGRGWDLLKQCVPDSSTYYSNVYACLHLDHPMHMICRLDA